MTQKIEKLLSVNNQELHGTVKALYNQWYRAQIINFIDYNMRENPRF